MEKRFRHLLIFVVLASTTARAQYSAFCLSLFHDLRREWPETERNVHTNYAKLLDEEERRMIKNPSPGDVFVTRHGRKVHREALVREDEKYFYVYDFATKKETPVKKDKFRSRIKRAHVSLHRRGELLGDAEGLSARQQELVNFFGDINLTKSVVIPWSQRKRQNLRVGVKYLTKDQRTVVVTKLRPESDEVVVLDLAMGKTSVVDESKFKKSLREMHLSSRSAAEIFRQELEAALREAEEASFAIRNPGTADPFGPLSKSSIEKLKVRRQEIAASVLEKLGLHVTKPKPSDDPIVQQSDYLIAGVRDPQSEFGTILSAFLDKGISVGVSVSDAHRAAFAQFSDHLQVGVGVLADPLDLRAISSHEDLHIKGHEDLERDKRGSDRPRNFKPSLHMNFLANEDGHEIGMQLGKKKDAKPSGTYSNNFSHDEVEAYKAGLQHLLEEYRKAPTPRLAFNIHMGQLFQMSGFSLSQRTIIGEALKSEGEIEVVPLVDVAPNNAYLPDEILDQLPDTVIKTSKGNIAYHSRQLAYLAAGDPDEVLSPAARSAALRQWLGERLKTLDEHDKYIEETAKPIPMPKPEEAFPELL
ncbi:MAG TPA: hypothetical protein VM901_05145 [Bdellovibrionota bacterium]|jgi:hypothetical protein|nr:hypothetical protein [Bdellovibrionota bacterium]